MASWISFNWNNVNRRFLTLSRYPRYLSNVKRRDDQHRDPKFSTPGSTSIPRVLLPCCVLYASVQSFDERLIPGEKQEDVRCQVDTWDLQLRKNVY